MIILILFLFQIVQLKHTTAMKSDALNRFSSLRLKSGKSISNRVVVPPMASGTADENGFATRKTLSHYKRLADSGAGLVFVEYSYIHLSGRSEDNQLGIDSDAKIEGLSQIAREIHSTGALAGIQITHAGGKTSRQYTGGPLMAPSAVKVPVRDRELETPNAMSIFEIELWKEEFRLSIDRAVRASFDVVELHAAHGYGLNQWLSPLTNHRVDDFGGSLHKNAKLLFEIVAQAKKEHPLLTLAVRLPGQDFLDGGLRIADSIWIAQNLEALGLDILDISSGIGGWRRPQIRSGEGYLVDESHQVQEAISLPVIGVGGIESGTYIDQSLKENRFSLAAVGRALLADPLSWGMEHLK